ncbi:efflux RND transporter periplasmic adaptor subunit [Dyadobacter psychrophilus]|uniref:Membrane fusion protein, multidrug efflux system n=1 Tax=Dyadobacter psychrophilus TaxID=651661 RepID=A0A1T5B6K3_9BACT|nr:efflux RND transporter periplasmic adaptor subunit [Dyadobacter psychrophilus]SKB42679.1 membrane fusion protein, multidrug efflux system [Dyadobacter psychrophilus]
MNQRIQLSLTGLSLMFVLFLSCQDKKQYSGNVAEQIKDYPVLTITQRTITLNSEFPATIEGQQDIEIRPKIDGFIEKIFVDEGATVKNGQALFKINAPQYEQEVRTAQANIRIAEADVNAAQMGVNKVKPLVEKNIISKYELESAQFTLQAKQAALAQAFAALSNARTNLGYTTIASPANGIVGLIPYKIGSLVNSNTPEPLTTVSNIGNIYAYFSINEKQVLAFSKNTKGNTTKARIATMPSVSLVLANGTVFYEKGRITTTSGSINTQTGSIRVRATFPNPGSIIRSGSSATVRIPSRLDSAIVIPQKSTYEIQGKKFVYRVSADGTVKSAEVGVLDNNDGQFFVAQTGLAVGDKIILEGVASLREGAKVISRPVKADSVYAKNL